jgi:hypothetical protein
MHRQNLARRKKRKADGGRGRLRSMVLFAATLVIVALALMTGGVIILTVVCFAPLLLLFAGTIAGLFVAVRTAGVIGVEQQRGRADVVGVTPVGVAGLNWAAICVIYYYSTTVRDVRDMARFMYQILLIGIWFGAFVSVLNWTRYIDEGQPALQSLFNAMQPTVLVSMALAVLYLDLIQSILLGGIAGMMGPAWAHDRLDAVGLALGAFLAAQLLSYAVVGVIAFMFVPRLYTVLGGDSFGMTLGAMELITLFLLRDGLLFAMWRTALNRLDIPAREWFAAVGQAPSALNWFERVDRRKSQLPTS